MNKNQHIVIIGGGYTGLVAAYRLCKAGKKVTIIEKESEVGGLARSFRVGNGVELERFYHHWFTNDRHIIGLIEELGLGDNVIWNNTNTGMFYSNQFYKLSSPIDLLKFKALGLRDRIRLGLLTIKARKVQNWKDLESVTAEKWLLLMAGQKVYDVVWKPLLKGKFGDYETKISAVWIWNKLKLRGGSRNKKGGESLAYYKGGFAALTSSIESQLLSEGVSILKSTSAERINHLNNKVTGVKLKSGEIIDCERVISTVALPLVADIFNKSQFEKTDEVAEYSCKLSSTEYIGNICLVLVLDRSLSGTYWLNVNDPDFPFVALIEHTNFEPPETYDGKHIVYLSKYLPVSDRLYSMNKDELLDYSLPYISRMFPKFEKEWIQDGYLWKEPYSQPIVTCNYEEKIPGNISPIEGLYVSCMAQIYPEDRGTNYAVKQANDISLALLNNTSENV